MSGVRLRAATPYEELSYFALSSVRAPNDGPPEARAAMLVRLEAPALASAASTFDENAEAYAALASKGLLLAQLLPRLFAGRFALEPTLRRAARGTFAEIAEAPCVNTNVHRVMARGPTTLAELLLCDMALAAPSFEASGLPYLASTVSAALPAVAASLEALTAVVPNVARASVVASAALGVSGRVYGHAEQALVFAGVTHGADAARETALLVLHEVLVVGARAPYGIAERAAIDAATALVAGTPFEDDHARRIARFARAHLPSGDAARAVTDRLVEAHRARDANGP